MVARGNQVVSLIVHCRAPSAPLGVEARVVQSLTGGALRVPRNDLAAAGRPTRMADTGDSSPLSWADLAEAEEAAAALEEGATSRGDTTEALGADETEAPGAEEPQGGDRVQGTPEAPGANTALVVSRVPRTFSTVLHPVHFLWYFIPCIFCSASFRTFSMETLFS